MVHGTSTQQHLNSELEDDYFDAYPSSTGGLGEDVDRKMAEARERLDLLRHEQQRVEAEERKLERLRLRQDEFLAGSRETHDQLQRALVKLEKDILEHERQIEAARVARETLGSHLHAVRGLAPERWADEEIEEELENALVVLEEARTDFERCDARIGEMGGSSAGGFRSGPMLGGGAALEQLKSGFLFTLPLVVGLLVLAGVIYLKFG